MRPRKTLARRDRDFFALVSAAALSNPFSDERLRLDTKIAQLAPGAPEALRLEKTVGRVRERIERLSAGGLADVRLYGGEDRTRMQSVFLFDIYHRLSARFDALIAAQLKSGDAPLPVAFVPEAIAAFAARGFDPAEARHQFAILFQLKRAYYFIEQGLVGRSASMKHLRLQLWNNVFTQDIRLYGRYLWDRMEDFSTLLLGETGTGKGTAAAAIGRSGFIPFDERRGAFAESFTRNLIAVDLALFPETLIESELFGHRKGAFTGAIENHVGVFALCRPHGSIFLDEIGDVSLPIQAKLLQVLQERTFAPVGSHERQRFSGRVIAATNKPLDDLRRRGQFRDDFYYRLCSDAITVPALRQRLGEDAGEMELVLNHIVARLVGEPVPEIVGMVREAIRTQVGDGYAWPGNVRELEQAARRIVLKREYRGDRPAEAAEAPRSRLMEGIAAGRLDADGLLGGYCEMLYRRHGSYEAVARRTRLDRRTVKRYVKMAAEAQGRH
jgi:DNA-binding NtrC family response regulator